MRRNMFELETIFFGSFELDCKRSSVPKSLLTLADMILRGPNSAELSQYSTSSRHQLCDHRKYNMKAR